MLTGGWEELPGKSQDKSTEHSLKKLEPIAGLKDLIYHMLQTSYNIKHCLPVRHAPIPVKDTGEGKGRASLTAIKRDKL